ncbi:hypothetical protein [Streptomyces sp. NPDC051776]|uniref:hypothetical protein n=1 Tax=Streptomyces sp. NPDC051776 TaxID=3155414 RepID=UPI0034358036
MRKVAAATAVVMAMAGVTSFGAGLSFADGGRSGATATGGSTAGADLFQQNSAQEGRLNSWCGQPSDVFISPAGARMRGRCLNHDGSFNAFAHTRSKGAHVEGGSTIATVEQQNIAQKGRLNDACANLNDSSPTIQGGRVESDCRNHDRSLSKQVLVKGGGARISGGSSLVEAVLQQNIAQQGRQNNACANAVFSNFAVSDGRLDSDCRNHDGSLSKQVLVNGGGAHVEGGSAELDVHHQNIAQDGRQNNACAHLMNEDFTVTGGRAESDCRNHDLSLSKQVLVKGGGAHVTGGSSTVQTVEQQNIAQEGRQNNACANLNDADFEATDGKVGGDCRNHDRSLNRRVLVNGGGAHVEGGSSTTLDVTQQNIAQEGRQNNACGNLNDGDFTLTGGRVAGKCGTTVRSYSNHVLAKGGGAHAEGESGAADIIQQNIAQEGRQNNACGNHNDADFTLTGGGRLADKCRTTDRSFNKHVEVKGGGAHAEGGSSSGEEAGAFQSNIAQEGRQNNACGNLNDADFTLAGGRVAGKCRTTDRSFNKHVRAKGGGARAEGGSATLSLEQQNIAQEARQNNACGNLNEPEAETPNVSGSQVSTECGSKDRSFNKHVLVKGGGARAEGGSTTGGDVNQQNIAQEGRQNNACGNLNGGSVTLTDSRVKNRCKSADESTNVGTKEAGVGALAEGGSSTADLFQQNTAQSGRQNNNCGNPNNLTLTATGSRSTTQCIAVDRSTNIGTINR